MEKKPSTRLSQEPCLGMKKRDEEEGEAVFGPCSEPHLAPLKMRAEWLMRIDFVAVREDKAWLRIQRDVPAALLATAAAP